jgi:lambda family phage portal protein
MVKTLDQYRPKQANAAAPYTAAGYGGRSAHMSADMAAQAMAGWNPPLRSADAEWLHERDLSIARIRDLTRNESWVQAGVDRMVDMSVGASFRLSAKPDARTLGITQDQADALASSIEVAWRAFANDPTFRCDAARQLPFPGVMGLAAREYVQAGEALAVLRWMPRENWPFATAVQLIDADRLSNPFGRIDDDTIRRGVEIDENGAPHAYHIRRGHPGDVGFRALALTWDRIPRFDDVRGWERPKVLHAFEHRRPGQHRGVSRLVAALLNMRMLKRYSSHELAAAAANATVVGAIYTQLGSEYAAEAIGSDEIASEKLDTLSLERAGYYRERRVLEDARFIALHPTDRMEWNNQPRSTAGLKQFQTAFLQNFASGLGISYEQLSMDWSGVNYSSARAALNEVWRSITRLRAQLIWGIAQPVYTAWLEDALDTGTIEIPSGAPDFYDAPAGWVQADWIGPPRGYVDPVKEAQAAVLRRNAMVSTLEREAAEQGLDLDQLLSQLRREKQLLEEYGLGAPATDLAVQSRSDMEETRPAAPAET